MTVLTSGDDTYTSTTPGDPVFGLAGNDTITASDGGNQLSGGDGDDTLKGGAGDDNLIGDDSTNTSYHNILKGMGGNDRITSYSWYDSINGGTGDDYVTVYAMTTGQIVDGGAGSNDTIVINALSQQSAPVHLVMGSTFSPTVGGINGATYTNFEALVFLGGPGSSTIEGGANADSIIADNGNVGLFDAGSLKGWGGDDVLMFNGYVNSGSGIERIDGGDGNDELRWSTGYNFSAGDLNIDFSLGKMKANGTTFATFKDIEGLNIGFNNNGTGTATISGGIGVDRFFITAASSDIRGFGGDDQIVITTGTATVDGGDGNDAISAPFTNAESHTFRGGAGNDTVTGGKGQDQIYGEDGDDHLSAYNGKSSLFGGAGADTLYTTSSYANSGAGLPTIDGGAGRDVLSIELSLYGAAFNADLSQASITLTDGTHIVSCEAITFVSSSGDDILTSSNDAGGYLVNKVLSLAGNDTLTASSQGATLDGGFGDDLLIAGAGADKLIGNANTAVGDTASYVNSGKGVTVDLTLLTAQLGAGDAKGDLLSSIENLQGSAHSDRLTGDSHANLLTGRVGNDKLTGGLGQDTLAGGSGSDTFIYNAATESSGAGFDIVTDFDTAVDRFQLSGAVAAIDHKVGHGSLTAANFDTDLGNALAGKLHAGNAIVFTPDAGDFAGHIFLIVDQNGQTGYQLAGDVVADISGASNLSSLTTADFTT